MELCLNKLFGEENIWQTSLSPCHPIDHACLFIPMNYNCEGSPNLKLQEIFNHSFSIWFVSYSVWRVGSCLFRGTAVPLCGKCSLSVSCGYLLDSNLFLGRVPVSRLWSLLDQLGRWSKVRDHGMGFGWPTCSSLPRTSQVLKLYVPCPRNPLRPLQWVGWFPYMKSHWLAPKGSQEWVLEADAGSNPSWVRTIGTTLLRPQCAQNVGWCLAWDLRNLFLKFKKVHACKNGNNSYLMSPKKQSVTRAFTHTRNGRPQCPGHWAPKWTGMPS